MDVCPSGHLDRENIMDMYAMPRRNAKIFIDQMFRLFDIDGDGTVSFKVRTHVHSLSCFTSKTIVSITPGLTLFYQEFVLATNMTTCGSAEDKL